MCVTDRHDMTVAVKVAINPNTINQSINPLHPLVADLAFADGVDSDLNAQNVQSDLRCTQCDVRFEIISEQCFYMHKNSSLILRIY